MEKNEGGRPPAGTAGGPSKPTSSRAILLIAALDMSWRLAIVVLVPIIGGFELDKYLGTMPVLTIIGFGLAMAGLFLVLKRSVAMADNKYMKRKK